MRLEEEEEEQKKKKNKTMMMMMTKRRSEKKKKQFGLGFVFFYREKPRGHQLLLRVQPTPVISYSPPKKAKSK